MPEKGEGKNVVSEKRLGPLCSQEMRLTLTAPLALCDTLQ